MTLGEYRVGITFNPGGNELVNDLKRIAADFIDVVTAIPINPDASGEIARLKALATTHIEDACMWAVKAATKPARE